MEKEMVKSKEVILALKKVKKEKSLSLDKIQKLMEENDPSTAVSKTTLSRVFSKGSEDLLFRYETTLRPIANALLDIENIETYDDPDTQAYKSILKLKMSVIENNSRQIEELKEQIKTITMKEENKYHESLARELAKFQQTLDLAMEQISLKDKRIDQLMITNDRLVNRLLDNKGDKG